VTLPILISSPHAGLHVPSEVQSFCRLTKEEIIKDGDEHAADIYSIHEYVTEYVTTNIARAIVDLNRTMDDRRADGVVKTHTCWNVPVYSQELPESVISQLLKKHYHPYHEELTSKSKNENIILGIDCHTMATLAPPIGPGEGIKRPKICLSDREGKTLPQGWLNLLAECFKKSFGFEAAINQPFKGGYIIQSHYHELPWLQLEIRRDLFIANQLKKEKIIESFSKFIFTLNP